MNMAKPSDGGPTVDRLRADIDAGRTGDKVGASDPAAAPLGTDEEAAGTPVQADAVDLARRRELKPAERRREGYTVPLVAAATLLAGLAFLAFLLLGTAA
jgi:hypothetical protein